MAASTSSHPRGAIAKRATKGVFRLLLETLEIPLMIALFVVSCAALLVFGISLIDLAAPGLASQVSPAYDRFVALAAGFPGGLPVVALLLFIAAHMARRALESSLDYIAAR